MATILPFKAVRPNKEKVHLVVSRSVESYSKNEINFIQQYNKFSFINVIKPEYEEAYKLRPNSPELLQKIKNKYEDFLNEDNLQIEKNKAFYVYKQSKDNIEYTGILALVSANDYVNGVIKVHEQTLTEKENKLKEYLKVCNFNAEPVCFAYNENEIINNVLDTTKQQTPLYDFFTQEGVRHMLWKIEDIENVTKITQEFKDIEHIYIADGHHRSASSYLLSKGSNKESNKYFLGILFSQAQLKIYDFNRLLKDTNGLTEQEIIEKLQINFKVTKLHSFSKPSKQGEFTMYISGTAYLLKFKKEIENKLLSIDSQLLTDYVLSPIFGITDLRVDKRVSFLPGIKPNTLITHWIDTQKYAVAFALFPINYSQLKSIADNNLIMPPKSTWVEPKLLSALAIYDLDKSIE
jgi:uncharacterized protein (DUF1015 family)